MIGIFRRLCSSDSSVKPSIAFKHKSLQGKNKPFRQNLKNEKLNNDYLSHSREQGNYIVSSELCSTCMTKVEVSGSKSAYKNEIIYGIYPVLLALQAQRRSFNKFYYKDDVLKKNNKVKEIYSLCQSYGIPSYSINKNKFKKIAEKESVHQGVCLEASHLPFMILEDPIKDYEFMKEENLEEKNKLWLYLDQINDPMNMGAVLRTAYYLGVDKVFTSRKDSCPITSVVSKASAGVAEVFPVYQVTNVEHFLKFLQDFNWQIIASSTSSDKSIFLDELQITENVLLIVGNEGRGVARELQAISDIQVTIPSHSDCVDNAQSLNVSVATSILLYALLAKLGVNKN